jgi:hypothetical protein
LLLVRRWAFSLQHHVDQEPSVLNQLNDTEGLLTLYFIQLEDAFVGERGG